MQSALNFLHKVNVVIVNPLITLIFAAAVLIFLFGIFEYVKDSGSEDARSTGRNHMLWGVVGMFVMVSAFGILRIIMNTIGADANQNGANEIIGN